MLWKVSFMIFATLFGLALMLSPDLHMQILGTTILVGILAYLGFIIWSSRKAKAKFIQQQRWQTWNYQSRGGYPRIYK